MGAHDADALHGFGTLTYAKGDKHGFSSYTGQWDHGEKHGHGASTWVDGSEYVGEYRRNLRHGRGAMTYATGPKGGTVLEGEWKEDACVSMAA